MIEMKVGETLVIEAKKTPAWGEYLKQELIKVLPMFAKEAPDIQSLKDYSECFIYGVMVGLLPFVNEDEKDGFEDYAYSLNEKVHAYLDKAYAEYEGKALYCKALERFKAEYEAGNIGLEYYQALCNKAWLSAAAIGA